MRRLPSAAPWSGPRYRGRSDSQVINALEVYRSLPRYVAARAVGNKLPGLLAGPITPLRLVHRDAPRVPGDGWVRARTSQ